MTREYLLKPEIQRLRVMLEFIMQNTRETYTSLAKNWDMDVQYIYDFNDTKNQKNTGNREWLKQVTTFYLELREDIRKAESGDDRDATVSNADPMPLAFDDEEDAAQDGDQLERTKRNMGLDENILRSDANRIAGSYRCYVLVDRDTVAVTWLQLYPMRRLPLPGFTAWRPDADGERRTFSGYYFMYEKILYLIGHRHGRAYPWNVIAVPVDRDGPADFLGELSASTNSHAAILTKCFLERDLDETELRRDTDMVLGEKPLSEVLEKFPELAKAFRPDALRTVDRPATSPV